jgi:hypothetical protein
MSEWMIVYVVRSRRGMLTDDASVRYSNIIKKNNINVCDSDQAESLED